MPRKSGPLQRAIIAQLYEAPGGRLPWARLKTPFPFEVYDKSFYRAVRALKKRGEIEDFEFRGEQHISLPPGRSREDRRLIAMTRQLTNNVAMLARARGLPESSVKAIVEGDDPDRHKHHIFSGNHGRE